MEPENDIVLMDPVQVDVLVKGLDGLFIIYYFIFIFIIIILILFYFKF